MIHLLFIAAALAAGPIKIDGANVPATDLVTSGSVNFRADSASILGGRVELGATRQKALDAKLASGSGSLVLTLVDNAPADTTTFTFGAMRLVRKLGNWYIVNTTGGLWRQVDLGPAAKGGTLRLAIVESSGQAHIYRDSKDFGATPYDAQGSQPFAIGSPAGETSPWTGEVKDLEFLGRALTAEDVSKRFSETTVPATTVVVTTPTSTPTKPANPGPSEPATKSTVVVADVTDLTEVPDPQSILPYRHALVTHEYKVIEVKSGHIDKVVPQAIIRVARWGVLGSKKTDIANLKKGDRVELTLEKYSDHPDLEHFYTVDTLPADYDAPYLLDTAKKAPAGGGG